MNSYLKFLSRNKLYTAIEAVGLAVSLAQAAMATSLFSSPDSMATPCSVKAKGGADAILFNDITICDIILTSSGVNWNIKSGGNRLIAFS